MADLQTISIETTQHTDLIPITQEIQNSIKSLGVRNGLIHLFVLHTTCGLTINENADPNVKLDLLNRLEAIAPWSVKSDRHMEGNSAAHFKSSLLGSSLTIPIKNGELVLGTWQGIFFGEFDGPRTRKLMVTGIAT